MNLTLEQNQDTHKRTPSMQASCSLSLSLCCSAGCERASFGLQGGHCARANTRNHSMSSSASDDLTSAYTGSDDICSSDYACNSEDIKTTTNPEKDDDPDSAKLSSNMTTSSTSQVRQAQFHRPCRARTRHQSRYHQRSANSG